MCGRTIRAIALIESFYSILNRSYQTCSYREATCSIVYVHCKQLYTMQLSRGSINTSPSLAMQVSSSCSATIVYLWSSPLNMRQLSKSKWTSEIN